jgi:hypothetical protein
VYCNHLDTVILYKEMHSKILENNAYFEMLAIKATSFAVAYGSTCEMAHFDRLAAPNATNGYREFAIFIGVGRAVQRQLLELL